MARKKILLVDDSATTLFMEEMILNDQFDLVRASNGEEALELAVKERPDLVLLDVVMPQMGGFEVCRRLREKDATQAVPIIMVTTRGEGENVERGYLAGCNDYVTKPIDSHELLTKVRDWLTDDASERSEP